MSAVRRARPLLGTFVTISVPHGGARDLSARDAAAAVDAAFAEIAAVQRCMSFHASDSDVARLRQASLDTPLAVDVRTAEVLTLARAIAARSAGAFDVTIAPRVVAGGALPQPPPAPAPDAAATWADIDLRPSACVRLRRPLWIDLGGIAKGYAVDRAIAVLLARGVTRACVNAGGDLRVYGASETVALRDAAGACGAALELSDGAVATSSSGALPLHWHAARREAIAPGRTATVVAPQCALADALTKVALALPAAQAQAVLAAFGAQAALHDAAQGWAALERAA